VRLTPQSLAEYAGGHLERRADRPIEGAFIDSRTPQRDALFVPIVAARDGHDFLASAVAGGASAILVGGDRPAPQGEVTVVRVDDTLAALTRLATARRAAFEGPVVAITGSNGKTTTRAMVAAVLGAAYEPVLCTQGNLNNHLGVPLTLLGEPHEPRAMVIELGMSAPGENEHLAKIVRPTVHVLTSIALEHLEFMGSIEAIAAAEAEPFAYVAQGGAIVVPSDEPLLQPHLPAGDEPRVVRFGPAPAQVVVASVHQGQRTRAVLRLSEGRELSIDLQLFGAHNARNAAAAVAVGLQAGVDPDAMVAALEAVEPVGDRGRVRPWGEHFIVADCYNANPGSMDAALRSLVAVRSQRSGPLVAVLGDMLELGPTEAQLHANVGHLAAELGLDAVVGIGPRSRHLVEAAEADGIEAKHFEESVDEAAAWLRTRFIDVDPGAVLVKASRGMKLERVIDRILG
jgi:UDP-N-acetylmuramoyl-tripeptide--D-alanyl-D-alanine ligase